MKAIDAIKASKPCPTAVAWLSGKTAREAWDTCERGDWMLWIAKRRGVDLKVLTLAKVKCVSLVKHLLTDERSVKALEVAERFALGKATKEELDAAAADADAAYFDVDSDSAYAVFAAVADYTDAAADAADAAADAAAYADDSDADAAATKSSILLKSAFICREVIDFDFLGIK